MQDDQDNIISDKETMRIVIAALAMNGLLAGGQTAPDLVAAESVKQANALMGALHAKKQTPKPKKD